MPDQFGQETPQEAVNRVRQGFARQRTQFANSNLADNQFAVAGQSLGNIFGGTIRKSLDTRSARKSEAERLVTETGMSVQEAREAAKESVPRDFKEVRQAKKLKAASKVASDTFAQLKGNISVERAQAAAETVMAAQLRRAGFDAEATAMTMRADERLKAEDLRELGLQKVKQDVTQSGLDIEKTQLEIDEFGQTEIEKLSNAEERLIAQIDNSDDADEIVILERELGHIEAQIAHNVHISLSDEDGRQMSNASFNNQMNELADLEAQDAELALLEDVLNEKKGTLASTTIGRFGAKMAGFAEVAFNVDPADIGADTLISDVAGIDATAAWVSARIRHALTGAAMSPAEAVFLQPFLATPGEPLSIMLGKVRVIRQFMALGIEGRKSLLEANREDPEGAGKAFVDRGLAQAKNFKPSFETKTSPRPGTVGDKARSTKQILMDEVKRRQKEGVG